MKNEDILNIIYPPQWVATILYLFISGAQKINNSIKLELVYLVLPLIIEDKIRERLNKAISTSSFQSIFEKEMNDKREYYANISERVRSFSKITNNGLILLGNETEIKFGENITVLKPTKYTKFHSSTGSEFYKAAYYLGLIFAKEDSRTIFLKLGVIPI